MLVQLPWSDIMTTNWDTVLARAADGAEERVYDIVRTVEEIPEIRAPRIIKLHSSLPAQRIEFAHQWFLEQLRAAEPYPARRWPHPPAGFAPPLTLVAPRFDPHVPLPEPENAGRTRWVETLRGLVTQWRQNRLVFPGWIVPPLDTCDLLWERIERNLFDIVRGLQRLGRTSA